MPEFDPSTPSIARVYDYALGGKDNYAADREVADRLLAMVPLIADMAIENRRFLSRSAVWAASQGISQFIDLGCGLPTVPNTHESVQAVSITARVAYVDNEGQRTYSSEVASLYMHTVPEIASFFGPLGLVPPGVADVRQWHQARVPVPVPSRPGFVLGGIARKR